MTLKNISSNENHEKYSNIKLVGTLNLSQQKKGETIWALEPNYIQSFSQNIYWL